MARRSVPPCSRADSGIADTAIFGEWWIPPAEDEIALAKAFLEFIYSPAELEAYMLAEGGEQIKLDHSDDFKAKQGETQVRLLIWQPTPRHRYRVVPRILDDPVLRCQHRVGEPLPSLADGTCTPE